MPPPVDDAVVKIACGGGDSEGDVGHEVGKMSWTVKATYCGHCLIICTTFKCDCFITKVPLTLTITWPARRPAFQAAPSKLDDQFYGHSKQP